MADNSIARVQRNMMKEMDKMFDSFFSSYSDRRMPSVDISEGKESYLIQAAVPGYDEDAISIYVEDHVLHLRGEEKERHSEEEEKKYLLRERRVSSFERAFTLPEDTDEEKLSASMKRGILSIEIAKKAKQEPRKIEVKIG